MKVEIVRSRETRLSGILSHLLIGLSILMVPTPLIYLNIPVLYGVFLFLAFTGLEGNHFWERVKLLFTQQTHYPPTHYLRRAPQKKVHLFTLFQSITVAILCIVGLFPNDYVQLFLPLIFFLLIPIRKFIATWLFGHKLISSLDT